MFSYGKENQVELDSNKITQLTAANGSGKTSVSMIIQEILFGKNVKGIKKGDILNRYSGSKSWNASLEFSVDEDLYSVFLNRTGNTSKVSLLKGETDLTEHKVLDTYKKIQEILGMNFEVFSQLTYQSSTNLLDFIRATDTNRKKFLINLFGLEKYTAIGDILKLKVSETEKELNKLEGELQGIDRFLEETKIEEKKETVLVPSVSEGLREELGRIQTEIKQYVDQCKRIDKNNNLLQERDSLEFNLSLKKPLLSEEVLKEYETSRNRVITLNSEVNNIEKSLSSLDLSDTCYTCGQPIDNSQSLTMRSNLLADKESKKLELDRETTLSLKLKEEIEKYNTELKLYESNQKKVERFEQVSQLIDSSLPTEYPNYETLEKKEESLKRQIKDQETNKFSAIDYNEQVKIHNTKVEALTDQKIQFLNRQGSIKSDIISLKSKLQNLTVLRKAFSTTGIVAFKLENLTKELEDTINYYLSELSDGQFQLVFRLTGEKLNIVIFNNGKETTIEGVSGGEFNRIQTSILLSIRKLLSKIGGNSINLLFLDEITGVLDDAGKERLIDILQQELDLNVFLISHDFTHPLINKINIVKESNISRIE